MRIWFLPIIALISIAHYPLQVKIHRSAVKRAVRSISCHLLTPSANQPWLLLQFAQALNSKWTTTNFSLASGIEQTFPSSLRPTYTSGI